MNSYGFWHWFFVSNWFSRLLHHKVSWMIGGAFAACYVSIVKYGEEKKWGPILEHKANHDEIVFWLILGGAFLAIHKAFHELCKESEERGYQKLLGDVISFANSVVRVKRERFHSALKSLKKKDIFAQITKPEIQINSIAKGAAKLICECFQIKENDLDMTIMAFNPFVNKWYYLFTLNDQWRHQKPPDVIGNTRSTAHECFKTGEQRFWPNKGEAAKRMKYFPSQRDNSPPTGSIFCHPFTVPVEPSGTDEFKFLISVVTHKKPLCPSSDQKAIDAALVILKEATTRLELELSLLSIKAWSDANPKPTQTPASDSTQSPAAQAG